MGRIWLVGSRGMLGRDLAETLAGRELTFVGTDIERDITRPDALEAFATRYRPDWIVNCSAYTAVDKAEDDEARARAINAEGAGNLAVLAGRLNARLLHLSTDYVFDGRGTRPYVETDPVAPLGAYARSKAEGEARVLAACPRAIILRTAWLYGRHGVNFVATMLRLMREREVVRVVADQHGTPTYTLTLCGVIAEVLMRGTLPEGIYHVTDGGQTSWHGFASEILARGAWLGLVPATCRVEPITTAEYPTRAPRPAYTVLSKRKIETWLGRPLPSWQVSLEAYLRMLAHASSMGQR